MNQSNTPRTDYIVSKCQPPIDAETAFATMNDHAEYLEVKLTTVTEQRDEWANLWAELSRSCVKDYVKLERELISITEQRDELLRYNEAFRKETLICADCDAIRKEEYDQAIEQRDRLADLVKQFIYILDITEESDSGRLFHPTNITSCRAGDLQKIGELVEALRRASRTTNPNEL